jgi:hypothetical protein
LQASYPYYPNATRYFPIRRAANETQYVLGRTLLQEAYLIVDYERANFTVAQAVFPDPLPAANIITITSKGTDSSSQSGSSGLGTGAIVGIAIGAAALFFLALFAFFFLRSRRTKKQTYELANNQVSDAGSAHHLNGATPMKLHGPSELSGTPLTELDSPHVNSHFPFDQKLPVSINDDPVELHAESRAPITPRWQEVHMPLQPPRTPYDIDHESTGSRSISQLPSDDEYGSKQQGPRSGISPLTGQFHHR